ncbi:alcohol dehydrogenase catalytic domain-containing protein [Streptomyces sp. NPDC008150]|uniref:glutathione-independent formaldehyde dehydrogenase n=1 Tax=Streptomyces sp. NPDC008150 TaxID=3364816 RepID=UPI0036F0C0E5
MKAVVYDGPRTVSVHDVPDPEIEHPTDVVVRVTSSALCGTDLHMYDGRTGAEPGLVLGHEPLGVVERAGNAVTAVSEGDRVVLPTHLYCGTCPQCARGLTAACSRIRPGAFGAAYGYAGMGPFRGAQAELLRVPFADANCVPLPGTPGDRHEDAFVLLADAFVTGWHATELAGVGPGDSVAVFGAGTVGLLAAHAALIRGAGQVYVVDHVPRRLAVAAEFGAVPVDFSDGDPVEQIRSHRADLGLPPGERGTDGVDRAIDAVGFQCLDRASARGGEPRENPRQVISDIARLVNPAGGVGVAGVYAAKDLDPAPEGHADGSLRVPWATLFDKGVRVGFGRTHDRRYTRLLRDLILDGRACPEKVITHHGSLADAPRLYRAFDRRAEGVVKAALRP